MDEIPLSILVSILVLLILVSAFFSSSETAMMSLNRYRLRHLAKSKHGGAVRAHALLEKPDRLIGLILLGNNFVNILASAIATIIALRLYGEAGIAVATGLLTLVILIFAEVTPKTLAALHPERVAFPASYVYVPMLKTLYPIVWIISVTANGLLRLLRLTPEKGAMQQLSREELRTVVNEAGALIPQRHQQMLLGILDLEKVSVEDIMIPRNEIIGIDLDDDWDNILDLLTTSQHTRMPVYRGDINNVVGMLHVRNVLHKVTVNTLDPETLVELTREPYYVPEATSLNSQLLNFQRQKRRIGLVVDEYGDINGLVTLEDILEEIVGEFTTDASTASRDIYPQDDGSFLVDAALNIRELNRTLHWKLPTDGPKTINGLILEYMESIPNPGTSIRIAEYPIEIVQTAENAVKMVKIQARLKPKKPGE